MTHIGSALHRSFVFACVFGVCMPAVAHACRKEPLTVQRVTGATVSFVGTSRADTLRAGPGDVRIGSPDDRSRPATRTVYGQRMTVERVSDYAREMLPNGVREVVLVPWAYNSMCQPVVWMGSARWLPAETRGVYAAELRAKSHWVDGVPTLDVFTTESAPARAGKPNRRNGEAPALSAEELIEVASRLPDPNAMKRDAQVASGAFLEWSRANPQLTKRLPAAGVVNDVVYEVRDAMIRRTRPAIAGTWKFTAAVEGGPVREFYARTHLHAGTEWYDDAPEVIAARSRREPWEIMPIAGYSVMTAVRRSVAELPAGCINGIGTTYMMLYADGVRGSTPDRIGGDLELGMVNTAFSGDTAFRGYKAVVPKTVADSAVLAAARVARGVPVRGVNFVTGADGVMRVERVCWVGGGRVLVLRGERVSVDVGKCGWFDE